MDCCIQFERYCLHLSILCFNVICYVLFLLVGSSGGNDELAVVLRQGQCYRWLVSVWFQCFWHRWTAHLRPTSPTYVSTLEWNYLFSRCVTLKWIVVNTIHHFTGSYQTESYHFLFESYRAHLKDANQLQRQPKLFQSLNNHKKIIYNDKDM